MSLFDELLYLVDGESAVRGDAATAELERWLARVGTLPEADRLKLLASLDALHVQAERDLIAVIERTDRASPEEIAEYRMTVDRLREVRDLIARK
jgi:hypothetical protein